MKCHSAAALGIQELLDSHFSPPLFPLLSFLFPVVDSFLLFSTVCLLCYMSVISATGTYLKQLHWSDNTIRKKKAHLDNFGIKLCFFSCSVN